MTKKLVFIIILLAQFQSGCTVLKNAYDPPASESTTPKRGQKLAAPLNVESQLVAAAQSIEQSLTVLAAAEKSENPPILDTTPLTTPEGGMAGKADIDWTGPLAPLIQKIAAMTDYRVKLLGKEPPIPVLITISAKDTPIADILQNASLQAGKRAEILVFPAEKMIEVRYLQ
jgi:defect in organelle trafficking protein DotD